MSRDGRDSAFGAFGAGSGPPNESGAGPDGDLDPALLVGLAGQGGLADNDLDALYRHLQGQLERERGLGAWLRARPTAARLALGLGLSLGLVLVIAFFGPRSDLDEIPVSRMLVFVTATASLFAASVWFGLRPLHRPAVSIWVERGIVASALVGMVALAYLPLTDPMPHEPEDWAHALPCMYGGLLIGAPTYLLIRLLDRGGRRISAFLAAAAAALAGNVAMSMHCANDSLGHLLRGHALLGVIFVGSVALWRWAMSRLVPRDRPRR